MPSVAVRSTCVLYDVWPAGTSITVSPNAMSPSWNVLQSRLESICWVTTTTCAGAVGTTLPDDAAEDSVSFLPVLEGRQGGHLRESLVHHSINGSFALRQGRWKLALCPGSGGWSFPRPGVDDVSGLPDVQLFDLTADRAETTNVQADHPDVVARLSAVLDDLVARGRSTPGSARANARKIDVREGIKLARRRPRK